MAATTRKAKEAKKMSAVKSASKKAAVKSTTKTAAKKAEGRHFGERIEDAKLKTLLQGLIKSGVKSKSGAIKAIRAKGIGVKGARVRAMFLALNKAATKATKKSSK